MADVSILKEDYKKGIKTMIKKNDEFQKGKNKPFAINLLHHNLNKLFKQN